MAKTNLVFANKSDSLRTTVPSHIIKILDLKVGDAIEWKLEPDGNRFKVVVAFVKKE